MTLGALHPLGHAALKHSILQHQVLFCPAPVSAAEQLLGQQQSACAWQVWVATDGKHATMMLAGSENILGRTGI